MTVKMTNSYTTLNTWLPTELNGSPFTVTVFPGLVDPTLCYSDVPKFDLPELTANAVFNYKINFVDKYGNLHFQTMTDDGLIVVVKADYNNHDDWPSPIGVADFDDWKKIYGTRISGTAIDKNDGTMTGSLAIKRAGTYTLSITIDGYHIKMSPYSPFKIKPASLYAPFCVPVDIPVMMHAGYDYSFLIQGRDIYYNNIADLIEDAVGADYSIVYTHISDSKVTVEARISDGFSPGVYLVTVTLAK